ncbi:hypothetical protein TrVE_jg10688 [Triparma verrucosa]|uniref:Tail specific protease domain-containing protein n=1 Tax=Triparma verrucosa TaxID=1606542 RepID=A0A9W7BH65_9STRA|nr:hypothetical protein TrVE_jg10688 [Triparma verrucosa]
MLRLMIVALSLCLTLSFTNLPPHIPYRHSSALSTSSTTFRTQRTHLFYKRRQPTDPPLPQLKKNQKYQKNVLPSSALALAISLSLLAFSYSTQAPQPPPSPPDTPSYDAAVDLIRYSFYDNTGGALFERTPQGIDYWSKKIRNLKPARTEEDMIGSILEKINDPFSSYIPPRSQFDARKEITQSKNNPGFLGSGAIVSLPPLRSTLFPSAFVPPQSKFLPSSTFSKLFPEVTAVLPGSLAERSGISTGTLILKVGDSPWFSGPRGRESFEVFNNDALPVNERYVSQRKSNVGVGTGGLFGKVKLVVATPVVREEETFEVIDGWRISTVFLGDPEEKTNLNAVEFTMINAGKSRVAYARLPNFSRKSSTSLVSKFEGVDVNALSGVILDLRNNFGGVIQESFMLAGGIIGVDSQDTVLAYTLDSRGAFRPQEVGEFFGDHRFPGFFMSATGREDERRKGDDGEYEKPSSFKSLAERRKDKEKTQQPPQRSGGRKHPKIVILTNEGTASSAEVFTAALRDNGQATVVGTRTYGKGLIQHIFPLENGKLKLTIGEYLTPKLQHVSAVGEAKNSNYFGGGIKPDVLCRSEGIPEKKENDLCVKIALEELGLEEDIEI